MVTAVDAVVSEARKLLRKPIFFVSEWEICMAQELGTLKKVELRNIWASEAQDFTPWLAQENNLGQLSKVLSMELELEAQEQNVGPFRADILCRNADDGSWVLIENQLERTDHIHLGQLLTYAAGLHAVTIVWVAATFTDEHRAALDWLNEITDDSFQFFGLEVELWKIGESPAAPKFNVVSKPNDWSRSVSQAAKKLSNEALTETQTLQLDYWTSFREFLLAENSAIRPQKPSPQHWANYKIGRVGFVLGALLNSRENRVGIELVLNDKKSKAYFWLLFDQKEQIESELGFPLDWKELPERKKSTLLYFLNDVNPLDKNKWSEYHIWMKEKLEAVNTVLRPRIKELDASSWQPDDISETGE